MQLKITGEQPFQVLATNFVIGPSNEGYVLQVSADGENYSNLFSVAANTTKMVTDVANGGFYRCLGNGSEITINWRKQCSDGQSGGGSEYHLPIAGVGDNGILGGVKVDGETVTIDSNGVISSVGGSDPELREDIIEGRVVAGIAKQLQSPDGVEAEGGAYIMRTTAGDESVTTGFANLNKVLANTVADEPVYEAANPTYNGAERFTVDAGEYTVATAETYTYSEGAWAPSLPSGVTVSGLVIDGDAFTINPSNDRILQIIETHFTSPDTSVSYIGGGSMGYKGLLDLNKDLIFRKVAGNFQVENNSRYISSFDEEYFHFFGLAYTGLINSGDYFIVNVVEASPIVYNRINRALPTVNVDKDTFKEAVDEVEGTYVFSRADGEWAPAIADYGITLSGADYDGDSLNVTYTAKDYGHLVDATPTKFFATGMNSFDKEGVFSTILADKAINSEGEIIDEEGAYVAFVKAVKNLEDGYVVYGDVDAIGLADSDEATEVSDVTYDAVVDATKDFIAITTYDINTLCVHPRWSGIKDSEYEAFRIQKIDLPTVDKNGNDLPAFVAVGNTRNEISLEDASYVQRVEVIDATEELIEEYRLTKEWGVEYVFDADHIYRVLDEPVVIDLEPIDNLYWADDFGVEGFEGTEIGSLSNTWYMANLVDKLRRDVVTKDELNIDRLTAVDALPEDANIGDVVNFAETSSLWKYVNKPKWGEWNGRVLVKNLQPNSEPSFLYYDYIPSELQGTKMCEYRYYSSYYGTTLYIYFDPANDRLVIYTSEVTDFTTEPYDTLSLGESKTWTFGIGSGSLEWQDGYFRFYNANYNMPYNECSTIANGNGWEKIDAEDKAITSENINSLYFPLWGENGKIIGKNGSAANTSTIYLNNTGYSNSMVFVTKGGNFPQRIFIPTQSGNQGQILQSAGNGEPTWINKSSITNGISFWVGSQSEYDELAVKDNSTLYIIRDED